MDSDDSDFYGDDEMILDLKAKVQDFDIRTWWTEHEARLQTIKRESPDSLDHMAGLHNPYASKQYAWKLSETIDDFLDRVPPATTVETPGEPWIWVANPYIQRKSKDEARNQLIRGGEDEAPEAEDSDPLQLVTAAQERLEMAADFIRMCKGSKQAPAFITRECNKAGADAAKDILQLAVEMHVTCGKWMIFCPVTEVNEVWGIVAKATSNNELGIAAKVAPKPSTDDVRRERLICIYTENFSDTKDVKRVAEKLRDLRLTRRKPLYYKPDIYTYLGIASMNPWSIRASIYDTKTMLAKR
ncbi:hypothetical protein F4780DRAFT_773280 [Xylariomycetidae sp. FL0641]|nr:hypothetical protein F4780DRAFT_773280 [Xylariomycetidae sp. FL0641]